MRKAIFALAAALIGCCAAAQTPDTGAVSIRPDIEIVVNGRMVEFSDGAPAKQGGRVLVPLRSVLKSLPGFALVWDPAEQSVNGAYLDRTVRLRIGSRAARVNGRELEMDVPATTIDGRTMVPLRFLSEALGAVVSWNNVNQRVTVELPTTTFPGSIAAPATRQVVAIRRPPAQPRRFFRTTQSSLKRGGVKFTVPEQPMTDAERVALMEQQLQAEYNQWAADRGAWMTDYANYLQWANVQTIFNSVTIYNGSSSLNGMPSAITMPGNPHGWAQWQAYLQMEAQRDAMEGRQFYADYATYAQFYAKVYPTGTPIPRPTPP